MQDVFVAFILFCYVGPIFLGCSLTDPTPYMRVFLSRACKQVSPPETMKQRLFIAAKAFLLHEHASYAGCADFYNLSKTSLIRMISEFRGTDAHMALLKMGSPSLTAAIGTASSSDSTPSSPVDPASAPVDPISPPVDYGLNSKGMPHTPYTAANKWGGNLMGDGMSARKAAAACQTKFQVPISKTTLQKGLNKGRVNLEVLQFGKKRVRAEREEGDEEDEDGAEEGTVNKKPRMASTRFWAKVLCSHNSRRLWLLKSHSRKQWQWKWKWQWQWQWQLRV